MLNLKDLINAAEGSHAVYLAAKHDDQLVGTITRTQKGTLRRSGEPLRDQELASILVYLTGKYGIKPSKWELRAGLIAAAEPSTAPRKKRTPPPMAFIAEVEKWLKANKPTGSNPNITTEAIAMLLIPDEFTMNRRGAEMTVAGALRELGFESRRMSIGGVRRYRWFLSSPTETS